MRSPTIASTSSVWPLPWTPAMRDDLARADVERHVLDGDVVAIVADDEVLQAEDDVARASPGP